MMISTRALAIFGLMLSLYALYVEHKAKHASEDPSLEFTALCDIQAIGASCSSVLQRPEGKLLSYFGLVPEGNTLDVPNALLGTIYYIMLLVIPPALSIHALSPEVVHKISVLLRVVTTLAFASTLYLLYALTFVVYDLCVLCMTSHVVNGTLMYRLVWRGDNLFPSSKRTKVQ